MHNLQQLSHFDWISEFLQDCHNRRRSDQMQARNDASSTIRDRRREMAEKPIRPDWKLELEIAGVVQNDRKTLPAKA
jgi:hypothetical protein